MNRLLVGIIVGMLGLAVAGWATASRSAQRSRTLAQRVARLERLTRLQLAINGNTSSRLNHLENRQLSITVERGFALTDSNGGAGATASCIFGKTVGGGAAFVGAGYYGDQINYSEPYFNGWAARGWGPTGAGRSFETYAVCAK